MVSHCRPTAGRRGQHDFSIAGGRLLPSATLSPSIFSSHRPSISGSQRRDHPPFPGRPLGGLSGPSFYSHSVHVSCSAPRCLFNCLNDIHLLIRSRTREFLNRAFLVLPSILHIFNGIWEIVPAIS